MDAMTIIRQHEDQMREMPNIMVSGIDDVIKKCILMHQLDRIATKGQAHIVVDMTKKAENYSTIMQSGETVVATIPGKKEYFTLFSGNSMDTIYRLRKFLQIAGYSEQQLQKALSYLYFLQHVESYFGNTEAISLELIRKYSSSIRVDCVLQNLENAGLITKVEKTELAAKYTELSSAGPDMENVIMTVAGILGLGAKEHVKITDLQQGQCLYVHLGKIKDSMLRKIILAMLQWDVEKYECNTGNKIAVSILAQGKHIDEELIEFIDEITNEAECVFITEDLFAIEEDWKQIQYAFPVIIYSRHERMESCFNIEEQFGTVQMIEETETITRDYHSKSSTLFDRLFGNDYTHSVATTAQIDKPKYRKEDIQLLPLGTGIVAYKGNSNMFHVR